MKNKILGGKSAPNTRLGSKSNPFTDIPIFDDVGSIGMPGLAPMSATAPRTREESKSGGWEEEGEGKDAYSPLRERPPDEYNVDRKSTGLSGIKRSRAQAQLAEDVSDILQDKENIPKIPKLSNINIVQVKKPFGKQKSGLASPSNNSNNNSNITPKKALKTVTIDESVHINVFSDDSDRDDGGDSRFATARREGEKASQAQRMGRAAAWSEGTPLKHSYEYAEEDSEDEQEAADALAMRDHLFSKVRHNHFEVVRSAIGDGSHNFHGRYSFDDRGNTLLHVAVQNNLRKMCSLLLKEAKCPLNLENHKSMTPVSAVV